jgi:uncharacterized membrane protein
MRKAIELSAGAIELLAVATIVAAVAFGTMRFLLESARRTRDAYGRYKVHLGKGLLLGLEMLVAADIIRTIALEPSVRNVLVLGMLVIIRTFLSWSLVLEIEGRWPWTATRGAASGPAPAAEPH